MKKLLLLLLILSGLSVSANEITEDYFDIASNYCVYGNYNEALDYLNKILQIEPQNPDANNLKNIIVRIKNPNPSKNMTTVVKPNSLQSELSQAKIYLYQRNYADAVAILNRYISSNQNSDIAYALRAEALLRMNNLQAARNDINKALDIDENISYLLTEAKILYHSGNYEDAKIKLNTLVKNVQTSEVYKYLGLCDYAENNYASALLNLNKAIILSDDDKNLNSIYNEIKKKLEENG